MWFAVNVNRWNFVGQQQVDHVGRPGSLSAIGIGSEFGVKRRGRKFARSGRFGR